MTTERTPVDEAWENLRRALHRASHSGSDDILARHRPLIEDAIRDSTERRSPESDIPEGQPCPICGPKGHGGHSDDSYGSCVRCYDYVPHSDTVYEKVAWPCPAARLAESEAKVAVLREAAREVVRFYGTDRTWSLLYRELLGSRIDGVEAALAATEGTAR